MGTSTSSKGGKAGSPFDPEWLTPAGSGSPETTDSQALLQGEFAPSRRFAEARTRLSEYISGGGRESLRAATRSMVSRGMGGSARAASTMRGTARGAGALGQFLSDVREKSDARVVDWINRTKAANLSAQAFILRSLTTLSRRREALTKSPLEMLRPKHLGNSMNFTLKSTFLALLMNRFETLWPSLLPMTCAIDWIFNWGRCTNV